MSDYTEGPWEFGEGDKLELGERTVIVGPTGRAICQLAARENTPADARLIRAAPDLYKAVKLRHAFEAMPADRGGSLGPKGQARAAWIAAETRAIEKIEGRA